MTLRLMTLVTLKGTATSKVAAQDHSSHTYVTELVPDKPLLVPVSFIEIKHMY